MGPRRRVVGSEKMPVDYKPAGYHTVTPHLVEEGAEQLIHFIAGVLDGVERAARAVQATSV